MNGRRALCRGRVRWNVPLVLLAILFAAWLINGIEPAGSWDSLLRHFRITQPGRLTDLVVLGLVLTAAVAIARILGLGRKEDA